MNLNIIPYILDSTYPAQNPIDWVWSLGIFLGELGAFLVVTFGVYYLSKKRVSFVDSIIVGLVATVLSFIFGVTWWLSIGFGDKTRKEVNL